MNLRPEQLRGRLTQTPAPVAENPLPSPDQTQTLRSAAVLIPMLRAADDWHLLFIRRAENGNDPHSGQVAFPGGRFEPGDADLKETALRETFEEIGLAAENIDIVGRLGDFISTTSYRIAPFVGVIPWPHRLRLAPDEVARAFTIPLAWLSNPANREVCYYPLPSGTVPVIRYRAYHGELLWGATARITVSLIQTLADAIDSSAAEAELDLKARRSRRVNAS